MKKRYKVVLNVEVPEPEQPFPGGGDYTYLNRLTGVIQMIVNQWPGVEARVTVDKVIPKGEVDK